MYEQVYLGRFASGGLALVFAGRRLEVAANVEDALLLMVARFDAALANEAAALGRHRYRLEERLVDAAVRRRAIAQHRLVLQLESPDAKTFNDHSVDFIQSSNRLESISDIDLNKS